MLFTDQQLQKHDIDKLKRWLRVRTGGYTVSINSVPPHHRLFRGVKRTDRPTEVSHLSYPPLGKEGMGRLNRPGDSIFYGTVAGPAVFYELRAKPGDLIAFSEWELTESLWFHHLGYHPSALRTIGARPTPERLRLTHPIPGESNSNRNMRRELSRAFTANVIQSEEYKYKQSIAINELLFDNSSPFRDQAGGPVHRSAAGTVYPSLQMRGSADNIAILPSFVDSSLRPVNVQYIRIEASNEASLSYTFLTEGIASEFPNGHIQWIEKLPIESKRRSHVSFENGDWVMRDGKGVEYFRQPT